MGSEWAKRKLGDLCHLITDGAHQSPKSVESGRPMASVKDLTRFGVNSTGARHISEDDFDTLVRQGCQPEIDDILIAKDGNSALDTVCRVRDTPDYVLLSSVAIIRPNKALLEPEYLKQYFSSSSVLTYLKDNFISGAAIPRVILKDFKQAEVPFPPLPEQKAIAHILGTLDDKIELNRRMNATLEGMAQALFKSWFVDFDPVIDNALAAGNPIPDELAPRAEVRKKALASSGEPSRTNGTTQQGSVDHPTLSDPKSLFPAAFEYSDEFGWIPENWEQTTIGSILEVTDYVANGSFASLKANVTLSDEPDFALYVRTTDFKNDFSRAKAKYTTKESYEFLEKSRLWGDEIIISNVGDTGTVFRPPVWRGLPMTLGSNAIALKTSQDCHYFYEYFRSDFGQHQLSGIVGGSAQPKFNKTDFRSLIHYSPSPEIREAYFSTVVPFWERHQSTLKSNEMIAKLRDTLLPKLISGELRLPEAEQLIEEAIP